MSNITDKEIEILAKKAWYENSSQELPFHFSHGFDMGYKAAIQNKNDVSSDVYKHKVEYYRKSAEEMITELDSALNFSDVKKLMIKYAAEALKEAAERVFHSADKVVITNVINELK